MTSHDFQSPLSPYILGFLEEKRSMGYSYKTEERILKRFDSYLVGTGFSGPAVTKRDLDGWMEKSDTEGAFNQGKRISAVRQLLSYMASLGIYVYLPHDFCHFEKKLPHILSKEENRAFFNAVDSYMPNKRYYRFANEYRVLFRMLYCLGLRNTECCGLPMDSVNLNDGTITILNSKGNKDRIIYITDDLLSLCRDYVGYLENEAGFLPEWFFPAQNYGTPLSNTTVDSVFSRFWGMTSFASCCNDKPTPHDLRFTFVVDKINQWTADGVDIGSMMPYLSRHLGHKSPKETFYYYHLAQEAFSIIHDKDGSSKRVIPEVVPYE